MTQNRDIREQQLLGQIAGLEASLAAAERFNASLEQMIDCFGIFSSLRDGEGRITDFRIDYLNPAAIRNNQLPLEEQLGRGLCELLPAHRSSGLFDQYREVVETGVPLELEPVDYEDAYGGRRLARAFEIRAWKLGDGFAAAWRDVTGRKQREERLTESELFFRQVTDSVPALVWTTGPDGYCDYLSQRWVEYTGIPEEEQRGNNWIATIHLNDRARVFAIWREAVEGRASYELEYRLRRHDGEYRWFKAQGRPIRDQQGKIVRWFGTSTDIEDQKRTEQEILEARRAAESANRAKDQFIAVLSHELRTPLTPVLTVAQMLESDPSLRPEQHRWVEMIRRNVELETRLIDDLLDHTRISRGKLELHPSATDLQEKILQTLSICESDARGKGLEIALELSATRSWIHADPARLQQALWNLLKNAVKFTPEGGRITVRTADSEDGGVEIEVRDTGVGIAAERLPRIFEAFEQGGRDVTRMFGGLGLGLAISRGIVELHGGTLTVESEGRGLGAVFRMRLPASLVVPESASLDGAAPRPSQDGAGSHRILVVDDHRDTLAAMAELLEIFGHSVQTADSVASALQAAEAERFEIVISDIGLPDGSGLDLIRQLRTRYPARGIALSGFGMEEDLRKSREAGFLEHLTKPVDFDLLQQALARVLALPPEA